MSDDPVYLVRHAKAEKESGAGGDAGRRLTRDGREAFAHLVAARRRDLHVTRILSSPFARAMETARLLADATGAPIEEEPELASGCCGGGELVALARRVGPGVALVGHNPEVREAVASVAGGDEEVPPGTIAALALGHADARLIWIASPSRDR